MDLKTQQEAETASIEESDGFAVDKDPFIHGQSRHLQCCFSTCLCLLKSHHDVAKYSHRTRALASPCVFHHQLLTATLLKTMVTASQS
jgi:hypothetical protein